MSPHPLTCLGAPRLVQPCRSQEILPLGLGVSQGLTPTTNNWYCAFVGKNTSFVLDEHYSAFIDGEIAAGRYRSASEVIRSALRLLEDRETQLRAS